MKSSGALSKNFLLFKFRPAVYYAYIKREIERQSERDRGREREPHSIY